MRLISEYFSTRCPSCKKKLSLLLRIFMNTSRGHECPACGLVIIQSKISITAQYFLMWMSLFFFVIAIDKFIDSGSGLAGLALFAVTFTSLFIVKIKSRLRIKGAE